MSNNDTTDANDKPEAEVDEGKKNAEQSAAGPAEEADPGEETVINTAPAE